MPYLHFISAGNEPALHAFGEVPCLHEHLADAARVKYPAALQRCKFDTPLLAAGSLIMWGYPSLYIARTDSQTSWTTGIPCSLFSLMFFNSSSPG